MNAWTEIDQLEREYRQYVHLSKRIKVGILPRPDWLRAKKTAQSLLDKLEAAELDR